MPEYTLAYPRKVVVRTVIRLVARLLMWVFTRTTITGKENLPKETPLILVGNHVALLEVVMMALYTPWLVEMIGTGDVPLDPQFSALINTYGMIPINRGSMDRQGLNMALDVLKQGGVIGIFPEGGIWETSLKQGRTGVAWLSHKANAPIVPIGFGGIEGALSAALNLKRPRLTMNIGPVIPPISVDGQSRRQALEDGAALVMERIEALIPEADKREAQVIDEHFDFAYQAYDAAGESIALPAEPTVIHREDLGHLFHRPTIFNTLEHNMRLPVHALQNLEEKQDPQALADAIQTACNYLDEHPYFLSYRFGYEAAQGMVDGLVELQAVCRWAQDAGYRLTLNPIRRYHRPDSDQEVVEMTVGQAHEM